MMKVTLRISSLLFGLIMWTTTAWAQPANDDCANAFDVVFSASEETVVLTDGDSRGATATVDPPIGGCSGSFYTDDTWYTFETPAFTANSAVVMRAWFGDQSNDVPAIGMALYEGCSSGDEAISCFSSSAPEDDRIVLPSDCLLPNQRYYIRIWSTGNTTATEGTFRVGVYTTEYRMDHVLWEDKFDSDPFGRGYVTYGMCAIAPDSSVNAVWKYYPDGTIPPGSFTPQTTIPSESFCDGAIAVHSDLNDSKGTGEVGMGPVPTSLNSTGSQSDPASYVIESPAISMEGWNVSGISVTFNQAVRNLRSTYTFSFRNKNAGDADWGAWTDLPFNEDLVVNDPPTFNSIRMLLPEAHNFDSIQLKINYLAHYYFLMIDDLRLVETECTNTKVQENWFTIAPWVNIPSDQVFDFPVLADILNKGACDQTNVVLNHKVTDGMGVVISDLNLNYGTIEADSLAENQLFGAMVNMPNLADTYTGTFSLTQDSSDFDPSDNVISYGFNVGGNEFALEDGATSAIWPAEANWDAGVPKSWAYGNFFMPAADVEISHIAWGINNPDEMEGHTVNVVLYQWTDENGDEVSSFDERRYVGLLEYTFTGDEVPGEMINSILENLDSPNPDDPITMQADLGYIAIIEHQALSVDDPILKLMGSNARAFEPVIFAFNEAFDAGLTDRRFQSSILSIPNDGSLAQVDYGANRFNGDWVPVVRIVTQIVNTVDQLPADNLVTTFPNPANDLVNVKLEFTDTYSDVKLRLVDNLGRVIYNKSIAQAISQHVESINVRDLAAGSYMLQVETPDGQRSVPVMIVK